MVLQRIVAGPAGLPLSFSSFWKRNSPSTCICLGLLCSLLQVIAVMYQTCWFTIYKWLWCRIWEFMTKEVESDKSDKTYFIDIKAMQSDACHLLLSKWHQRTRRAKYFHQILDLINIFIRFTIPKYFHQIHDLAKKHQPKKRMLWSSTYAWAQIKEVNSTNFVGWDPFSLK